MPPRAVYVPYIYNRIDVQTQHQRNREKNVRKVGPRKVAQTTVGRKRKPR